MTTGEQAREITSSSPSGSAFEPVIGPATTGLGEYLVHEGKLPTEEAFKRVRDESLAIVRRCLPFNGPNGSRTGLVVGYVQSGKTMSMMTVASLARDNGCRIIILLAGVTTNLLRQNANRFRDTLRGAADGEDQWHIINSDDGMGKKGSDKGQVLRPAVEEWRDKSTPERNQRTLFFAVLKHHKHLEWLAEILKSADLKGVPAIVLDDEADQAGLNVRPNADEASLTYTLIKRVRDALPHHTYLQYTATPQAPLLINIDDVLSPEFAELVEPGDGYAGGTTFFSRDNEKKYVVRVPEHDLFEPGEPPEQPPESLKTALKVFFVGCAIARGRRKPRPRSMLVHPSSRTKDHARFLEWINGIVDRWSKALAKPDGVDYEDTVEELNEGYVELAKTDASLPSFKELIPLLLTSLRRVTTKEVNSQDGSEVDWANGEEHILVGGEKLNRGYTVEGLTVTYMPRDAGGWTADTLQQRARFFGYKQSYLPICRLYLHQDVAAAYRDYVVHETDVRKQLAALRGEPLRKWRRAFFLDSKFQPTRRNVLKDSLHKIKADQNWFIQRYPHLDLDAAKHNRALIHRLIDGLRFKVDPDSFYKHGSATMPLSKIFKDLLVEYRAPDESASWYAQLVYLSNRMDDQIAGKPEQVRVLLMDNGEHRKRTPEASGVVTIHQGRTSALAGYEGDKAMFDQGLVTVQIHLLDVVGCPKDIPALAIHIANKPGDVIVQDQPK